MVSFNKFSTMTLSVALLVGFSPIATPSAAGGETPSDSRGLDIPTNKLVKLDIPVRVSGLVMRDKATMNSAPYWYDSKISKNRRISQKYFSPATPLDAGDGTCAAGYTLYNETETRRVYTITKIPLYTVSLRKRWCANGRKARIGSVWQAQGARLTVWGENFIADKGTVGRESRYFGDGNGHPRAYHLTKRTRQMKYCNPKNGWPCYSTYWTQGINAWSDGGRISWTKGK